LRSAKKPITFDTKQMRSKSKHSTQTFVLAVAVGVAYLSLRNRAFRVQHSNTPPSACALPTAVVINILCRQLVDMCAGTYNSAFEVCLHAYRYNVVTAGHIESDIGIYMDR
jgi:hypothetical protein